MEKEFLDIVLKDAENVTAAFLIHQNINDIKYQILHDNLLPLIRNLARDNGLKEKISLEKCFETYWGFSFKKEEWKKLEINFSFESRDLQKLFYGFKGVDISEELKIKYSKSLNYRIDKDWPLYKYMDNYGYWDKEFFLELFKDENKIKNVFDKKIKELLSILDQNKELLLNA